ncbi:agamous-like MADS-box protein AGL70 isoform X2 [Capsicum annuum]|uniref:agamous-like MADS-box protein AGL70 isoform X2 n=1 Tax=Capsicum annuum TaxID=4072 RepID=UPI001FB0A623|nr:agamous-like MADS-box protein AGL70 isoform X2 [Capsicum annuum]
METCGNIGLGLKKKKEIGRRKLEIKRIQDKNCRQVAFCKRRQGLIKKANELSILCNVDVGVVIISKNGTGRLHEYSSTNRQLEETNADGHTVTDLIHLQNELQTSLTQIRSKKTQLMLETVKDLLEKEKQLREEKKILKNNRARMKKKKEEVNGMSDLPPEG